MLNIIYEKKRTNTLIEQNGPPFPYKRIISPSLQIISVELMLGELTCMDVSDVSSVE